MNVDFSTYGGNRIAEILISKLGKGYFFMDDQRRRLRFAKLTNAEKISESWGYEAKPSGPNQSIQSIRVYRGDGHNGEHGHTYVNVLLGDFVMRAHVTDYATAAILWLSVRWSAGEQLDEEQDALIRTASANERIMREVKDL